MRRAMLAFVLVLLAGCGGATNAPSLPTAVPSPATTLVASAGPLAAASPSLLGTPGMTYYGVLRAKAPPSASDGDVFAFSLAPALTADSDLLAGLLAQPLDFTAGSRSFAGQFMERATSDAEAVHGAAPKTTFPYRCDVLLIDLAGNTVRGAAFDYSSALGEAAGSQRSSYDVDEGRTYLAAARRMDTFVAREAQRMLAGQLPAPLTAKDTETAIAGNALGARSLADLGFGPLPCETQARPPG